MSKEATILIPPPVDYVRRDHQQGALTDALVTLPLSPRERGQRSPFFSWQSVTMDVEEMTALEDVLQPVANTKHADHMAFYDDFFIEERSAKRFKAESTFPEPPVKCDLASQFVPTPTQMFEDEEIPLGPFDLNCDGFIANDQEDEVPSVERQKSEDYKSFLNVPIQSETIKAEKDAATAVAEVIVAEEKARSIIQVTVKSEGPINTPKVPQDFLTLSQGMDANEIPSLPSPTLYSKAISAVSYPFMVKLQELMSTGVDKRKAYTSCLRCKIAKRKCDLRFKKAGEKCTVCEKAKGNALCTPQTRPLTKKERKCLFPIKKSAPKRKRLADSLNKNAGKQCSRDPFCTRPLKHPGHCKRLTNNMW
mmetsp:Transcript_40310/g.65546  ORF Transcript_40310/g.65546 Transcript_40310/m.65546 type:complete len:364 (-) Transcript_40310:398-1489(-)|eukprot:jgi/Bigna1/86049/estExt_fgenesh1_pg.C_70333